MVRLVRYPARNNIQKIHWTPRGRCFFSKKTNMDAMDLGVSKNRGTPKSSILIVFSIINHPFWGSPILGNIHLEVVILTNLRKISWSIVNNMMTWCQKWEVFSPYFLLPQFVFLHEKVSAELGENVSSNNFALKKKKSHQFAPWKLHPRKPQKLLVWVDVSPFTRGI